MLHGVAFVLAHLNVAQRAEKFAAILAQIVAKLPYAAVHQILFGAVLALPCDAAWPL
jgi:hypothetical protein